MKSLHTVANCEFCEEVPGYIEEIRAIDPACMVSVGDVVLDANDRVWVIDHYLDFFRNDPIITFYTPGREDASQLQDICWCKTGAEQNKTYHVHIESDPHGPFSRLLPECC